MGCDIHAYVDYDVVIDDQGKERTLTWQFCHARFPREYSLFALMAGGLRDPRWEKGLPFPVKGLPERLSGLTEWEYTLRVTDDEELATMKGWCTTSQAKDWTTPLDDYWPAPSIWIDDQHTTISHPDWHTPSWLTPDEFEICLKRFEEQFTDAQAEPECWAILAAMRALEEHGYPARLVFWFDN